jgi:hypothetical protein
MLFLKNTSNFSSSFFAIYFFGVISTLCIIMKKNIHLYCNVQ